MQYTGTGDDFNFATVIIFKPGQDQLGYNKELMTKVHPNLRMQYITQETQESREIVTSRLLNRAMRTDPTDDEKLSSIVVVNYHQSIPGKGYFGLRRDHILLAMNLTVEDGTLDSWGLWQTRFPRGNDVGYHWIAADFYSDMEQMSKIGWIDIITRANPDANIEELTSELMQSNIRPNLSYGDYSIMSNVFVS